MEQEISQMLQESISYMDSKEAFYHGFLTGIYKGMSGYMVKSNRESGNGRYDLLLITPNVKAPVALFELKIAESYPELEKKCNEALAQIVDRNYEAELRYEGYRTILKYGVAFYRKSCLVKKMQK